jgi:predicted lysophospholipase L1 biosynthesis ABC-type transport system permease subunit
MVRGLAHQRDLAVLASLGATRGRLVRGQVLEAMLAASACAAAIPARRATRIDPATTLRAE